MVYHHQRQRIKPKSETRLKAVKNPFVKVINGARQFKIPVFQRDYSWEVEQCEQLWNDVLRAGKGDSGSHFVGSFVYADDVAGAAFASWLVIDGQQRLTTLMLLLTALRDHIIETGWVGDEPTPNQIDAYYLKNLQERGDRHYKLALRRRDNETLRALIAGKNADEVSNQSGMIVDAYDEFSRLLKTAEGDVARVYRGIARLEIVDVTLDRRIDNPQLVFESLNSTGIALTESDLIRNYLLMGLSESEQTQIYEEYWSRIESLFREAGSNPDAFLRDYVAFRQKSTTQIRADRTYAEFKEFWQESTEEPFSDRVEEMFLSARRYARFLQPNPIEDRPIRDAMRHVRRLGSVQATLVMRLYECLENGTLSQWEFVKALNLIESYLVRRSVLRWQTRNYWSVFARIAQSIDAERPFTSFQVALARQTYSFPSDDAFSNGLAQGDLYGLRVCAHILSQLENAGYSEPSPTDQYSIEHIMPQQIEDVREWQTMLGDEWEVVHKTWLHRLGNLTLTAYNSTYSNRSFDDKKRVEGGFDQSAVRLNEFVRQQSQWTEIEMAARSRFLSERALKIWPNHGADPELIAENKLMELLDRAAGRDPDSLKVRSRALSVFNEVRDSVKEMGEFVEVVERKSVSYYDQSANFLVEVLPMSRYVRVLVPLDFDAVYDPDGIAMDVTQWKFLPNVVHRDCGVFMDVSDKQRVPAVAGVVRQALQMTSE